MAGQTDSKTVTETSALTRGSGPRPAAAPRNDERSPASVAKEVSGIRGIDDKETIEDGVTPVRAAKAADAAEETDELARKAVLGARRRSLRAELNDFVMPKVSDPSILHANSLIGILEDFVVNRLPKLEGTSELRALAETVIKDEIARHRAFLNRRHHGIAA